MPSRVITLMEKIETSVAIVIRRTIAKAPKTATEPTRVGIKADTRLPKMSRQRMKTIGIEIASARAMSLETVWFTSLKTAHWPPTVVVSPGASRWGLTWSYRLDF